MSSSCGREGATIEAQGDKLKSGVAVYVDGRRHQAFDRDALEQGTTPTFVLPPYLTPVLLELCQRNDAQRLPRLFALWVSPKSNPGAVKELCFKLVPQDAPSQGPAARYAVTSSAGDACFHPLDLCEAGLVSILGCVPELMYVRLGRILAR